MHLPDYAVIPQMYMRQNCTMHESHINYCSTNIQCKPKNAVSCLQSATHLRGSSADDRTELTSSRLICYLTSQRPAITDHCLKHLVTFNNAVRGTTKQVFDKASGNAPARN
jgi:hypothetical protein